MSLPVGINKLSAQLGLTSRTLRYWESEGLFSSKRDLESGWRVYEEDAVICINITDFFRKLDIPLKDIKAILEIRTFEEVEMAIRRRIHALELDTSELALRKSMLSVVLDSLAEAEKHQSGGSLTGLGYFIDSMVQQEQNKKMEDVIMEKSETFDNDVRFITLPPMRVVYNTAIGASPEDEAMAPVIEWLESDGLLGTARLFGGNVEPLPSKDSHTYGYGMCASIPAGIKVPGHLKEMDLPGGLYAMMPSSEDIFVSWQLLMKCLSQNSVYTSDRSRLCLEEHIRNDNPKGQRNQYMLNLLEPVKKRNR